MPMATNERTRIVVAISAFLKSRIQPPHVLHIIINVEDELRLCQA